MNFSHSIQFTFNLIPFNLLLYSVTMERASVEQVYAGQNTLRTAPITRYFHAQMPLIPNLSIQGMTLVPSPVNSWHFGSLLISFTLIPPHGPGCDAFAKWDLDAIVTTLAVTCPKLKDLNLSNCTQVTDASLVVVARHCKKLERLNLNRCDLVSTTTVMELAQNENNLVVLNLSRPLLNQRTVIEDAAISALVKTTPHLMELRLRNCDLLTDKTVLEMAETCGKNLRALDLR